MRATTRGEDASRRHLPPDPVDQIFPALSNVGHKLVEVELGQLQDGDGELQAGEFRDLYTFEGEVGDPITIDVAVWAS